MNIKGLFFMNAFDEKLYKALVFFANNNLKKVIDIREKKKKEYNEHVSKDIEDFCFEHGYIDADSRYNNIITAKGLEQLRTLSDIKLNQRAFWISLGAIVISVTSLILSIVLKVGGN